MLREIMRSEINEEWRRDRKQLEDQYDVLTAAAGLTFFS